MTIPKKMLSVGMRDVGRIPLYEIRSTNLTWTPTFKHRSSFEDRTVAESADDPPSLNDVKRYRRHVLIPQHRHASAGICNIQKLPCQLLRPERQRFNFHGRPRHILSRSIFKRSVERILARFIKLLRRRPVGHDERPFLR